MTGGMLSGSGPASRVWQAQFWFSGQPGIPAKDGLPGVAGTPDTNGWVYCASFERLASNLIAGAAWQCSGLEPAPEMINFGEILLRHGRRVAERTGRWTYGAGRGQGWADVTVIYDPTRG